MARRRASGGDGSSWHLASNTAEHTGSFCDDVREVVPADAEMMEEVFDTMLECVHGDADAIANDRRFATAIYRIAVMDALMSLVRFADPD